MKKKVNLKRNFIQWEQGKLSGNEWRLETYTICFPFLLYRDRTAKLLIKQKRKYERKTSRKNVLNLLTAVDRLKED